MFIRADEEKVLDTVGQEELQIKRNSIKLLSVRNCHSDDASSSDSDTDTHEDDSDEVKKTPSSPKAIKISEWYQETLQGMLLNDVHI